MKGKRTAALLVGLSLALQVPSAPVFAQEENSSAMEMFRLYNPNSGEHFYTGETHEKNELIKLGWKDEGIGWKAPAKSNTPVYRLYNPNAGDHHYTMDENERKTLAGIGWTDEGIRWYSDDTKQVPLYRQYNPNAKAGAHNYTIDQNEHSHLIGVGWKDEGISWYGLASTGAGPGAAAPTPGGSGGSGGSGSSGGGSSSKPSGKDEEDNISAELVETDLDAVLSPVTNKTGSVSTTENPDWQAEDVQVNYTVKEGTGYITIQDITDYSYLSRVPGRISAPVDIHLINDELEAATIIFHYDELPEEADPQNLGILWYDKENDLAVPMENCVLNEEEKTVSVDTPHFSEYVLVNMNEWYENWAREQLVFREDIAEETPYFNIVYVLDNSGSMSGSKMYLCKQAAKQFIAGLNVNDRVSVIGFADSSRVYVDNLLIGTYHMYDGDKKIDDIYANGGTDFDRALYTALEQILKSAEWDADGIIRQNLIIFLSDGEPTTDVSNGTMEYLKSLTSTSGIRAMTIGLGQSASRYHLQEIAENGNGHYYQINDDSEIEGVFEQINAQYVGSTKDSDGDGIPDLVETTGMRTQFGDIVRTDPNNPDTDGDGLSDRQEMGVFVRQEEGKSYFRIESDPKVPTALSDTSLVYGFSASLKYQGVSELKGRVNVTWKDLENHFKDINLVGSVSAVKRKTAKDCLSETLYPDAKVSVIARTQDGCCWNSQRTASLTVPAGDSKDFLDSYTCQAKNPFTCAGSHQMQVTLESSTGAIDGETAKNISRNSNEVLKEMLEAKRKEVETQVNSKVKETADEASDLIAEMEKEIDSETNKNVEQIEAKLSTYMGKVLPPEVDEAFMAAYTNPLIEYVKDGSSKINYSKCKNSADLVNMTTRALVNEDQKFTFTVKPGKGVVGGTYTAEAHYAGIFGSALGEIQIQSPNGKIYTVGLVSRPNDVIDSFLADLKKLADIKVKEAKKALIKASIGLLEIKTLKKEFGDLAKKDAVKRLNAVGAKLPFQVRLGNGAKKLGELYKAYENYEKLFKMNDKITQSDYTNLIKNIKSVQDSLEEIAKFEMK